MIASVVGHRGFNFSFRNFSFSFRYFSFSFKDLDSYRMFNEIVCSLLLYLIVKLISDFDLPEKI